MSVRWITWPDLVSSLKDQMRDDKLIRAILSRSTASNCSWSTRSRATQRCSVRGRRVAHRAQVMESGHGESRRVDEFWAAFASGLADGRQDTRNHRHARAMVIAERASAIPYHRQRHGRTRGHEGLLHFIERASRSRAVVLATPAAPDTWRGIRSLTLRTSPDHGLRSLRSNSEGDGAEAIAQERRPRRPLPAMVRWTLESMFRTVNAACTDGRSGSGGRYVTKHRRREPVDGRQPSASVR